jgi:hypothetical protein
MSFETPPMEVPDHVRVTVPNLSAALAVECSRCGVMEWLYLTVLARDRNALVRAVDTHRHAALGSSEGEGAR